ncbi:PREDICTED: kinesin-like protein KIF14 [Ceratosolen solmsi marchali]|uniref:Kinesin-like protein KIF14 n=1 Tax=Ceratosolen solmsi marchali TaxID=326594 RepID=A0AAJ6VIH1_9HYME|nr:PREDICTED: kinesin-like protein KIF14 [Ceratosolen solmsi marchali]
MSHNNTEQSARQYGFCNAIFSNSPTNFNKENKPPTKADSLVNSNSNSNLSSPSCKKNLINYLPYNEYNNQCSKNVEQKYVKTSKVSSKTLVRAQSDDMIQNQDDHISLSKCNSEEKIVNKNMSNTRLSGNKTPVTHFCTPKNILNTRSGTSSSRRHVKRYFSDNSLHQTPDCFNSVHLETPKTKTDNGIEEQTLYEGENSNLTVGIRVRPLSFKEQCEQKIFSIVEVNNQNLIVDCDTSQHTFIYDHCFISYNDPLKKGHANQESVFNTIGIPLVQSAFEGYNVCLLAYGQTGSGKSYSMMGSESAQPNSLEIHSDAGIIPRFCHEIFSRTKLDNYINTTVEISYFEIYNEKIHDLLISNNNGTKKAPLKVREHPVFGPYIVDLSQHIVQNYSDLKGWLKVGNSQKATAATGMNEKSSRSHSIFTIILTQTRSKGSSSREVDEVSRRSKINLVDLAGSERLSNTCASGNRLREGVSINKSLLTLGKVIGSLADSTNDRKRSFVPYRESVLTWLLKESLGGNSRTAMLGTISPANVHLEETLATLRYAYQARAIVNRIRINENPNDRLIRQLKAEVQRLKSMRDGYEKQLGLTPRKLLDTIESSSESSEEAVNKQREIDRLKYQLKKMEEQLFVSQKSWEEKLREAKEKKNSELTHLRRCGIAIELDFQENAKQPFLVNLAADPMLSGTLLYLIPPGRVRVGRGSTYGTPAKKVDIVLEGPLMKTLHCAIENNHGKLTFYPEKDGENFVNGELTRGKVQLKHGDRLVIGGNHYFKVCNPLDEQDGIQMSVQPIDFDFAHQEVLRIQEEKLRAELEESKQKAMKELENAKREVEMQLDFQKSAYEDEIKQLGCSLEEQKSALEEMNRKKKELEREKELLASEIETNNKIRRLEIEDSEISISTYKSNFLQELEEILNETTADVQTALTVKTSIDAMKTGGVSLHEIQLLVREATGRCREVGVNYEFHQQQIVVDKGLQPVIRVRDKDNMVESLWQPIRFLDWIHQLRDHELEHSIKELQDSDDKWEPFEESDIVQDSLYCSRISVNMTPVKRQLNESLSQFSVDASFLDSSTVDCTSESIVQKRRDDIHQCLIQMELASKTLKGLCHQYESREISGKVTQALDKVHIILQHLKTILEVKAVPMGSVDNQISIVSNVNNTMIDKAEADKSGQSLDILKKYCYKSVASPAKSNLRSACPYFTNDNASRSVKFNIN